MNLEKLERIQLTQPIGERRIGVESRFVDSLIYTSWESKIFLKADKSSNRSTSICIVQMCQLQEREPLNWVAKKKAGIQEEEKHFNVISCSREQLIISKEIEN